MRASRSRVGSNPSRGSKRSRVSFALRIRSRRNDRSPSLVRSHVWTYQFGSSRSSEYGSTSRVDGSESASFWYSISTSFRSRMPRASLETRSTSSVRDVRLGRLGELELPERLLELLADARQRRVRVGGDHRPDVLEGEPDRARLERRQARRGAERVAPQLLVDVHRAVVQLGIDRVAAAAEVDEVEEGEVLLELVGRDRGEALEQLRRRDLGVALLAACCEEIREQRLQHGEALGRDGPGRALGGSVAGRAPASRARAPAARPRGARARVAARPLTSRLSSAGSSGTARPFWRSTHDASWGMEEYSVTKTPSTSFPVEP